MNTDNMFAALSAMFPSEVSYMTFVEMANEMELELMDMNVA